MSTQTAVAHTQSTTADYDPQRPYRDCSAIQLAEWVEAQYSQSRYDDALVVELATRALELEALKRTAGM
ncbi:MAG: hypothetical protein ACRDZ4_11250 [Egibacteraceae bacterium]